MNINIEKKIIIIIIARKYFYSQSLATESRITKTNARGDVIPYSPLVRNNNYMGIV